MTFTNAAREKEGKKTEKKKLHNFSSSLFLPLSLSLSSPAMPKSVSSKQGPLCVRVCTETGLSLHLSPSLFLPDFLPLPPLFFLVVWQTDSPKAKKWCTVIEMQLMNSSDRKRRGGGGGSLRLLHAPICLNGSLRKPVTCIALESKTSSFSAQNCISCFFFFAFPPFLSIASSSFSSLSISIMTKITRGSIFVWPVFTTRKTQSLFCQWEKKKEREGKKKGGRGEKVFRQNRKKGMKNRPSSSPWWQQNNTKCRQSLVFPSFFAPSPFRRRVFCVKVTADDDSLSLSPITFIRRPNESFLHGFCPKWGGL